MSLVLGGYAVAYILPLSTNDCYLLFIFLYLVKSMKSSQMLKFVNILKIITLNVLNI